MNGPGQGVSLTPLKANTHFEEGKGYEPPQHSRILKDQTIRLTARVQASIAWELTILFKREVKHRAIKVL